MIHYSWVLTTAEALKATTKCNAIFGRPYSKFITREGLYNKTHINYIPCIKKRSWTPDLCLTLNDIGLLRVLPMESNNYITSIKFENNEVDAKDCVSALFKQDKNKNEIRLIQRNVYFSRPQVLQNIYNEAMFSLNIMYQTIGYSKENLTNFPKYIPTRKGGPVICDGKLYGILSTQFNFNFSFGEWYIWTIGHYYSWVEYNLNLFNESLSDGPWIGGKVYEGNKQVATTTTSKPNHSTTVTKSTSSSTTSTTSTTTSFIPANTTIFGWYWPNWSGKKRNISYDNWANDKRSIYVTTLTPLVLIIIVFMIIGVCIWSK